MNFRRSIKYWWQRRTRGWDDSETWNIDWHLAKWLEPRLRRFAEITTEDNPQYGAIFKVLGTLKSIKDSNGAYDYTNDDYDNLKLLGRLLPYLWW